MADFNYKLILKEYFPDFDDSQLLFVLWNCTGFPHFWNIPEDGESVEMCFRKQLSVAKEHYDRSGFAGFDELIENALKGLPEVFVDEQQEEI